MRIIKCWICLTMAMLWSTAIADGQTTTDAAAQAQGQALQNQVPGLPNADLRGGQSGVPIPPQAALDGPGTFDGRGGPRQGQVNPGSSQLGGPMTTGQPGAANSPPSAANERPGELGVFLVAEEGPGVQIVRTVPGTAADAAGLRAGDVILEVNGEGVEAPPEVTRLVRSVPAGETVKLHIWRNGADQEVTATLQPAGETRRVGFRDGAVAGGTGDLESRVGRLEQQLVLLMQEVQLLQQEMTHLHSGQAGVGAGTDVQSRSGGTQQSQAQPASGATPSVGTPPASENATNPSTGENDTGLPF